MENMIDMHRFNRNKPENTVAANDLIVAENIFRQQNQIIS